jgi:hypothetical protein
LNYGLVNQESINIKKRKFIAETSMEFLEWVTDEDNFQLYLKCDKAEKFQQFTNDYKDFQKFLTRKKFDIWVQKYAAYIDHKYLSGHSGSLKWFMIHKPDFNIENESLMNKPPF